MLPPVFPISTHTHLFQAQHQISNFKIFKQKVALFLFTNNLKKCLVCLVCEWNFLEPFGGVIYGLVFSCAPCGVLGGEGIWVHVSIFQAHTQRKHQRTVCIDACLSGEQTSRQAVTSTPSSFFFLIAAFLQTQIPLLIYISSGCCEGV